MIATAAPRTGVAIQLVAIAAIDSQFTAPMPAAVAPAPITPPTMAWVVETGAPIQVEKLIQRADEISAASMMWIRIAGSEMASGTTIAVEMVATTALPARRAPRLSQTAAMASAPAIVIALAPTAGPTLLATSFAPMLSAR